MDEISLKRFESLDQAPDVSAYLQALEAFDAIPQMQELKALASRHCIPEPGCHLLDVGCGFGLETLRLAPRTGAGGSATGLDSSAAFIAEARRRAEAAGIAADFRVGDAEALPFGEAVFDAVRAERLLIYLTDVRRAVREMLRVLKPGGRLALIEPDFSTTTVNLPDRAALRRALAHEVDTAVVSGWLPGPLLGMLDDLGAEGVAVETRVAIFPQDLGAAYFSGVGRHAAAAGALSTEELAAWLAGIADLTRSGRLFGSVGYFLFTARR